VGLHCFDDEMACASLAYGAGGVLPAAGTGAEASGGLDCGHPGENRRLADQADAFLPLLRGRVFLTLCHQYPVPNTSLLCELR